MADASPPPGRRSAVHVRHLTGPLAGQAAILRRQPHVVFGTAEACHVRFPPGTAGVAPEHFELNWDAGHYELRVNRRDPVYLNGRRAADGDEPTSDCTLQVGEGGPTLSVHLVVRPPLSRRAMAARVAVAVLALAVGGVAVKSVIDARARARRDETLRLVQEALAARDAEARNTSWDAIAASAGAAVYLVIVRDPGVGEEPLGTAWVVAPGRLATNAHVVEAARQAQADGRRVVVRSSTPPHADAVVTGAVLHPAFEPFTTAWKEYAPMAIDANGRATPRRPVLGYDVGLLDVAAEETLAAPLRVASPATLHGLRQGEALAFLGYPMERLLDVDQTRPNPRLQTGTLVALSAFTMTKTDAAQAQLLEHSLPATGGASGSPIFNRRGDVVGLLSAGNVVMADGGRLPNAAMVNYAQRVDVLGELLTGEPVDLAALRRQWSEDFKRYDTPDRAMDIMLARLERSWIDEHGGAGAVRELRNETLSEPWTSRGGRPSQLLSLTLTSGHYLFLMRGDRHRDIDAVLSRPQLLLPPEILASDDARDSIPVLRYQVTAPGVYHLVIEDVGPAEGAPPGTQHPVTVRILRSDR